MLPGATAGPQVSAACALGGAAARGGGGRVRAGRAGPRGGGDAGKGEGGAGRAVGPAGRGGSAGAPASEPAPRRARDLDPPRGPFPARRPRADPPTGRRVGPAVGSAAPAPGRVSALGAHRHSHVLWLRLRLSPAGWRAGLGFGAPAWAYGRAFVTLWAKTGRRVRCVF